MISITRKTSYRLGVRPARLLGLALVLALVIAACATEVTDDLEDTGDLEDTDPPDDDTPAEPDDEPAAAPEPGGELVFATSVAAPSLHPYTEISDARMRRSPLMYDTLVEWDDNFEAAPGLAEDWDLDGDVWTFHLREGVTFHNGQPFTSADVIYSMEQVLDSPGAGFYAAIEEMEALDDYTVRFHLSEPSGPLLAALGGRYAFIVPEGAVEDYNLDTTAVGTGVFEVAEFQQGEFLRLEKNPDHWRADEVSVDALTIEIVDDESSIVAGLRGGTIHAAIFEDVRSADLLAGEDDITVTEDEGVRWDVLDFPLDVEPFSILEFRQAIASAIDREAVMELAIGGRGTRLGGHPPALWGAMPPEEAPFAQRDLGLAEQLLAESGFDGTELTLTSIQGFDALNAAAQVIADNLSDLDLTVTIEMKELGVWIDEFLEGTFDTFTMNSWGGFVDPDLLYFNHFRMEPDGADFRRWNNEEITSLLDEGRFTVEHEAREDIYWRVQEIVTEQVPLVPLYSSDFVGAHRTEVSNWSVHPSGFYHDLRWLAIDQ